MWPGHGTQREQEIGLLSHGLVMAVGTANQEYDFRHAGITPTGKLGGKIPAGNRLAPFVQHHHGLPAVFATRLALGSEGSQQQFTFTFFKSRRREGTLFLDLLNGQRPGQALPVLLDQCYFRFALAGAANGQNTQFHQISLAMIAAINRIGQGSATSGLTGILGDGGMVHPDIGEVDDLSSNWAVAVKRYVGAPNLWHPFLVGLTLLLTACATPPISRPVHPQLIHDNLLTLAAAEWRAFGSQTVFIENGRERIDPVGTWEDDRRGAALVAKYWRSVGASYTGYDCDKPWSAAFISWLMQAAGVPTAIFPPSKLHADYLRAVISEANRPDALFIPHDPALYVPKPGDLICARRGATRIERYDVIPEDALLHCDVVMASGRGWLASIGGNVRNSVSKTIRPVDAAGLLGSAADRPWFLALELRVPSP